ncbi:winged helix-turn-helix transcriptional regulator [Bradyrhizobium elkanii]|uniref:winged helix-turn-helix transcriptional regulator n=1 Tax=Bradyrhizobium elkanii TaxID=29448 RepID=UPI003515F9AA
MGEGSFVLDDHAIRGVQRCDVDPLRDERQPSSCDATIPSDKWCLLILREAGSLVRTFEGLLDQFEISRSVLEQRLCVLTELGLMRPIRNAGGAEHLEYSLTAKGFKLLPTVLSILRLHGLDRCAGTTRMAFDGITTCSDCGEVIASEFVRPRMKGDVPDGHDQWTSGGRQLNSQDKS